MSDTTQSYFKQACQLLEELAEGSPMRTSAAKTLKGLILRMNDEARYAGKLEAQQEIGRYLFEKACQFDSRYRNR